jgi:hypothetical protein
MDNVEIYCPKCHWVPDGKPHWRCTCGTVWDTFSTGARCPGCGKVWGYTRCVSPKKGGCGSRSPHLDWYHGLTNIFDKLKAEIKEDILIETKSNAAIMLML